MTRLEVKALLGSLDHGLSGANLRLANGARGLDVDYYSALYIDEIIIRISKEGRSTHRPCPLRRWIGRRNKFGHHIARCSPSRVIERCKIILHRTARGLPITLLVPLRAWDRSLLVGIRGDQAGI